MFWYLNNGDNKMSIKQVLQDHKLYVNSLGKDGVRADLRRANLRGAILPEATFIIPDESYFASILNGSSLRAGCQSHPIKEWFNFTKSDIAKMDGKNAIKILP